jgi:uncharacterized protein (DUF1778 family)
MTDAEGAKREKRLFVRLTADEAARVAQAADTRGMTVSDFVRRAVLRRSSVRIAGERMRSYAMADVLDGLQAINAQLRQSIGKLRDGGSVAAAELEACLERSIGVIMGLGQ